MADKNFARSGTADTDLLADDDPLSELARLVNFEPRPVQGVSKSHSEAAQAAPRYENPVLALEDELMRAFEQFDMPIRGAVEPVVAEKVTPHHIEPVFDEPAPVVESHDAQLDDAPSRDLPVHHAARQEPAFEEHPEPVFANDIASSEEGVVDAQRDDTELEADPALLLADELEAVLHDVPSVDAKSTPHAGQVFAERFEPRFEEPARNEPVLETYTPAQPDAVQPAFLGLQPVSTDESLLDDVGLALERELELSIGDGFADELFAVEPAQGNAQGADASFVEPLAVEVVESHVEPRFDGLTADNAVAEDAQPFQAESVYEREEPHFVEAMPYQTREDHARVVAEAETQWQAEEPAFAPEPDYQVESVAKGQGYDHDALLADIERYPVPESRSAVSSASVAAVAISARNPPANISAIFGRATPVAHRGPAVEKAIIPPVVEKTTTAIVEPVRKPIVETVQAPVVEARREPVALPVAAAEPEIDLDNMEFDLSDIDLDLSDFSLDDEPVKHETKPVVAVAEVKVPEKKAEVVKPVEVQAVVRREPAVAVPVSTYTRPQPLAVETNDGALPFDPSMIADTDEGVSPVTEVDVPQLPVIEKEKPPVYQPDYDFDIDAEMAQLFSEPAAKAKGESRQAGVAAVAAAASNSQPTAQINDVDDFERALEEDFRRSLNQPERMAIPVDPGQASPLYSGDGYDDEPARPRRGLLIAASIAGLVLIGGGGVYAWSAFTSGSVGSGEPRVILADKEPVKVVPEEKGGKTVPNQDKAVYDRVAGDNASTPQQEQLVTSTEEPVDVVQRTLTPETLPFDGPEDGVEAVIAAENENRVLPGVDEPATATADGGNKPLVSPRKVKTMIVKPDGTLVAREEIVTEPATETAQIDAKATGTTGTASGEAATNATLDANASLRDEQGATDGQPRSALAEAADAEVDDTAPVRTVKTTTIGATSTSTDGNTPVPVTRPIDQPVTVVGTVTENGNVRDTQTAEATPTQAQQTAEQTQVAAVAPGSYVIQIASLPSEAEAQKSYNSLSSKFGSVIGGRGVDIKKAEIPNKGTFFRVRIPAGSRDEANSLCSRYKSAGGSCLVTR
ncbi:SPOR domain-containing protein [Sinorhizobium sp. RAC02]|uniref:SPOR domain-containing protein n=1 Tax=Sinorhizobium sp. RAC02 TaxID=1842534 RepID=UPI00083DF7D4|nr:SPOR domain-containing protein [Sinorhizobium sp. RAC02]AOF90414.1 sporulation related domain protein [Sinorhizobium sp. RAC02]